MASNLDAPAAERWRQALADWAIPEEILAAAPESPWTFPVELFARRADAAPGSLTLSNEWALEALSSGGTVLDVGCGAGAASLPLAPRAGELIGVDSSAAMLDAFRERAERARVMVRTLAGAWPDVASETPSADVVVCHHVVYNAPDLPAFATALTTHARARVVVELTQSHPQSSLNDLWLRFHGLRRPDRPTVEDAVAVLREAGLQPERADWSAPPRGGFEERADLVAWIRRRLCLTPDRDPEVETAMADRIVDVGGLFGLPPQPLTTLWWEGRSG
jgi:SAM-dependent methyltransferase